MRTTIGQLLKGVIYAFVYGAEGVGKTRLIMSLARPDGHGVAFVTPEPSGPTSVVTAGYPADLLVELLPQGGSDPCEAAAKAIAALAKETEVDAICVDGITVLCGRAIDFYSDGAGEKALGYDGWGQVLNGFRSIEKACEAACRAGKSVVLTAWENEPVFEQTLGGRTIKAPGRALLKGQAKTWLPGNCDIVARMTSKYKSVPVGGKIVKQWTGALQVNASEEWHAKSRWTLPDPCPADLRWILDQIQGQKKDAVSPGTKPKIGAVNNG